MNSFKQLNSYSDELVTFQSQDNYSIDWGANLGNATVVANVSVSHNLQNRQVINAINNPLLPLIIQVNAPVDLNDLSISNITYSGPNGNIEVEKVNNNQWLIGNIWTVSDYNEVFNNTSVAINSLRTDDFAYQTVVSDQLGETRTFFTTVDVVPFGFSRPGSVTYNEDQTAQITGMAITDISNLNYTCTFNLVPALAGNLRVNTNQNQGNSVVVSGSRNQVNTVLASGIAYIPADDYVANSNVSVSVFNNSTNTSVGTANIQLLIGQTHADFSVPPGLGYSQTANINVGTTPIGNVRITDLAVNRQYSSTLTLQDAAIGNLYNGATLLGNTVTYTGNSVQVNNNLANVTFVPNSTANTSSIIRYTQVQTTAGITQAGNVSIPLTYQVPAIHINSGVPKPVGLQTNTVTPFVWNNMMAGNATPNVDYWAWLQHANLNAFRDTNNFVFQPMGISLQNRRGIVARQFGLLTRNPNKTSELLGRAGYFSFWIRLNQAHGFSHYCAISSGLFQGLSSGSSSCALSIGSYNSNMFITPNIADVATTAPTGSTSRGYEPARRNTNNQVVFRERIALGPNPPVGTWTHIAIQITDGTPATLNQSVFPNTFVPGTQVVSVWRDGQPITQFFNDASSITNGLNWIGKWWFNGLGVEAVTNISAPNNPGYVFSGPLVPWCQGVSGSPNGTTEIYPNITIDDVYITDQAIRTNLEPFTPVAESWISPPALGLLTGV